MSDIDLYLDERAQLIREDRALRTDQEILDNLTSSESRAEQIIRDIRQEEAASVWAAEHPEIPHLFPGMEFLTARSLITQTKIFKILNKVLATC
jgi:adenosine deaminase CECR1